MKHYVVGLIFNAQADKVVFVGKNRPEKLAGKINGIGGKVEPGESVRWAMSRETREETGLIIPVRDWHKCADMLDDCSHIHIFRVFTPLARLARQQPGETEKIYVWRPDDLRIARRSLPDLPVMLQHARNPANRDILHLSTSVRLAA